MAPPRRPSGERGAGDVENDPEREKRTQANVRVPTAARGTGEVADDPERERHTVARPKLKPRPESDTGASAEYRTGSNYGLDSEDPGSRSSTLEGDGLDALDPELEPGPRTRATPALEDEGTDADFAPPADEDADDENATRAGPPLELEIVAGPDQGTRRRFKGVRMVIGRTSGVDLQLSDQSVSRRHVELVSGDQGVLMRDLGSGNGTRVNGSKMAEKVLEHGDEIHIGKTKIRFLDQVGAFRKAQAAKEAAARAADEAKSAESAPADDEKPDDEKPDEAGAAGEAAAESEGPESPASSQDSEGPAAPAAGAGEDTSPDAAREGEPKRSRTAVVRPLTSRHVKGPPKNLVEKLKALPPRQQAMVGGAAALLVLLLVLAVATRKPPAPPVDPAEQEAATLMQQARDAVRAAKYEEAIALIDKAEKLKPGSDLTKLAGTARTELATQRSLDEVRSLLEGRRFDEARTALARIPAGTVKTEEARRKLTHDLEVAEAAAKKERFDQQLAAGDLDGARAALPGLSDSDRRDAESQLSQADQAAADAQKAEAQAAARNAAVGKKKKEEARAETLAVALAVVTRKLAANEWDRAAAECDRVIDQNPGDDALRKRAKQLQQLIPTFGRNFDDGMKKYRAGQLTAAARPLKKAREAYLQISLPTRLGDQLDEALAEAAVSAAREAMQRDDLGSAAVYYREATKLNPDDPKARAGLNDLIGRADELYQKAYMIRDRDPREALQQFKVVVDITPVGSATHEKAKNQIAAMQP